MYFEGGGSGLADCYGRTDCVAPHLNSYFEGLTPSVNGLRRWHLQEVIRIGWRIRVETS